MKCFRVYYGVRHKNMTVPPLEYISLQYEGIFFMNFKHQLTLFRRKRFESIKFSSNGQSFGEATVNKQNYSNENAYGKC